MRSGGLKKRGSSRPCPGWDRSQPSPFTPRRGRWTVSTRQGTPLLRRPGPLGKPVRSHHQARTHHRTGICLARVGPCRGCRQHNQVPWLSSHPLPESQEAQGREYRQGGGGEETVQLHPPRAQGGEGLQPGNRLQQVEERSGVSPQFPIPARARAYDRAPPVRTEVLCIESTKG